MRVFAVAVALSMLLAATSTFAQAPESAAAAPQAPAAPAAPAAAPFQDGLKYAYINVARIAAESNEGKAATDKVRALNDQKVKELNEKNRQLQASQQKLDAGGSVLSDAARAQLQSDIDRQTRDIQRFTEDAQQDVTALQQQLQDEFQRKLNPVIDKVAREKQVHMVFSAADSGLVWADPGLDLTTEIIRAFDSPAAAAPGAAR